MIRKDAEQTKSLGSFAPLCGTFVASFKPLDLRCGKSEIRKRFSCSDKALAFGHRRGGQGKNYNFLVLHFHVKASFKIPFIDRTRILRNS